MTPYEALYGRKCGTPLCWIELSENKLVGSKLIRKTGEKVKMINDKLKAASDRQKLGKILISLRKKVLRFGEKGKLSSRFIGPYEVIERIGLVAYRLALPSDLAKIHNVFHVSMLRRYRSNPLHVITTETIDIQPDLTYDEEPVKILAREIKELGNKINPLVKILWKNHNIEEATWESEEVMRQQYPQLFDSVVGKMDNDL
ncbi:DNA/RNA polymerases superfamily protein [Gossypium australe]|uniref:DNA/RNA polymerases superfamily protein n=1 Tax=Gossypium australe TaxID=47621 RepID=A0A5B6WVN0_9ROSI|nr:DNA/RNA polymerases superfamily protein [Gossypium australe]